MSILGDAVGRAADTIGHLPFKRYILGEAYTREASAPRS